MTLPVVDKDANVVPGNKNAGCENFAFFSFGSTFTVLTFTTIRRL